MSKFTLGDTVTNSKIGQHFRGKVIAIMSHESFLMYYKGPLYAYDSKLPGWQSDPIYLIAFDAPQKNISLEEFRKEVPWIKDEFMDQKYAEMTPLSRYTYHPEGDLEIAEELSDPIMSKSKSKRIESLKKAKLSVVN